LRTRPRQVKYYNKIESLYPCSAGAVRPPPPLWTVKALHKVWNQRKTSSDIRKHRCTCVVNKSHATWHNYNMISFVLMWKWWAHFHTIRQLFIIQRCVGTTIDWDLGRIPPTKYILGRSRKVMFSPIMRPNIG